MTYFSLGGFVYKQKQYFSSFDSISNIISMETNGRSAETNERSGKTNGGSAENNRDYAEQEGNRKHKITCQRRSMSISEGSSTVGRGIG